MHKPLFIGISLSFLTRNPWSLQETPLLVDLERQLCHVLSSCEEDGGNILCKLLQTLRQVACVSENVAHWMLQMPGPREVSGEKNKK
jgi:hypothetical protein